MHLIDEGVAPSKATEKVHTMFIDYRVPLPKEIKLLSDTGLIMFPMFLGRVQRAIFNLAVSKPVTTLTMGMIEGIFDIDITNIQQENLINRDMKDAILNNPSQSFSLGEMYPQFLV